MAFRDRLKNLMFHRSLRTKDLAALAGIGKRTLDNYLRTQSSMPRADVAVKLARVLGVPVEHLVCDETPPAPGLDKGTSDAAGTRQDTFAATADRRSGPTAVTAERLRDATAPASIRRAPTVAAADPRRDVTATAPCWRDTFAAATGQRSGTAAAADPRRGAYFVDRADLSPEVQKILAAALEMSAEDCREIQKVIAIFRGRGGALKAGGDGQKPGA